MRAGFEFHASDLWNGRPPFDKVRREQAQTITEQCVWIIQSLGLEIFAGIVDKKKLSGTIYATANPIDMAFRLCMEQIEGWMAAHAPSEISVIIFDDAKETKNAIKSAFRSYRRKVRSADHNRGKLRHVVDDIFFGDSSDSVGIQIADVCAFLIDRHIRGKEDTEYLYKRVCSQIHASQVFP